MSRIALAASLCLLITLPQPGQAQIGPDASAPSWFVQLEGGGTRIHDDEEGVIGAVRLGRYLDRNGILAVTLNAAGAATDGVFGSLTLGLQLQAGQSRFTPTVGGRVGVLVEEGFVGDVLEGTAGLAFRIAADQWIRLSLQLGRHSDAEGPHTLLIGYQAPL
jgi:hypothetical protein